MYKQLMVTYLILGSPILIVGSAALLQMISFKFLKWCKMAPFGSRLLMNKRIIKSKRTIPPKVVHVIDTASKCEEYMNALESSGVTVLGLDCEWVSWNKRGSHPVALLQLASPQRECYLIRICKMDSIPPALQRILANKSILKFGVGIAEDSKRLTRAVYTSPVGCVDINWLVKRCHLECPESLRGLAKELLNVDLEKKSSVRRSNWEAVTLSSEQVKYAALDALIAIDIIHAIAKIKLESARRRISTTRGSSWLIRLFRWLTEKVSDEWSNGLTWDNPEVLDSLHSLSQGLSDVKISTESMPLQSTSLPSTCMKSLSTTKRSQINGLRKTPLYDNYKLLAQDGELLSTINKKKVQWYLQKGLAEFVDDDCTTLMLKFEPTGRPDENRVYYLSEKHNRCVVCGKKDGYLRKNIIPHDYKKYFPVNKKSHLCHDILLLCADCHQLSCQHDSGMRHLLAQRYNAPLSNSNPKSHHDQYLMRVKSHAKALLRGNNIPVRRCKELKQTLLDYFKVEDISKDMIVLASQIDTKVPTVEESHQSHGEKVMNTVLSNNQLNEFQILWRKHFINTMQPKFLPEHWSLNHNL